MSASNSAPWHLITGEYPPVAGGIADYSALVAEGLTQAGIDLHVWTTGVEAETSGANGPTIHRGGEGWSRSQLVRLGRALDAFPAPRRLLIQYAPNSWGFKGMNLGFCRWLLGRKKHKGDKILSMIHEVCFIPGAADSRPIRRLLPLVQRPMASQLLAASDRVFVSTPRWAELLAPLDSAAGRPLTWLPVPSTIPVAVDPPGVAEIRRRLSPDDGVIVGSFGTFSNAIGDLLAGVLPSILGADTRRIGLLIGRNGEPFATRLIDAHPELAGRLVATGGLQSAQISSHLQACDLLVQPYPDGICGRRTTFMAALVHGVAAITTEGRFTTPIWRESGAVALAPEGDPGSLVRIASALLDDDVRRVRLGQLGRELYASRFALDRTVEALLASG